MNKRILEALNEFCLNEYGTELDKVEDTKKIPIMYTSYEKGELEEVDEALDINVYFNLDDMIIFKEINGVKVYEEWWGVNDNEALFQIDMLDFDAWTNLDELDEYMKLKGVN